MVAAFVECGSRYENGCLSSGTRRQLLEMRVDSNFFTAAKYEVAKDIMMNSILRGIVERHAKTRQRVLLGQRDFTNIYGNRKLLMSSENIS